MDWYPKYIKQLKETDYKKYSILINKYSIRDYFLNKKYKK